MVRPSHVLAPSDRFASDGFAPAPVLWRGVACVQLYGVRVRVKKVHGESCFFLKLTS